MSTWLCVLLFIVLPHLVLAAYVFGSDVVRAHTWARYPAHHGPHRELARDRRRARP